MSNTQKNHASGLPLTGHPIMDASITGDYTKLLQHHANCEAQNILSEYEQRMEAIVEQIRGCDSSLKAIGILSREMKADTLAFAYWMKTRTKRSGELYVYWDWDSPEGCATIRNGLYTTEQLYELYKQKP